MLVSGSLHCWVVYRLLNYTLTHTHSHTHSHTLTGIQHVDPIESFPTDKWDQILATTSAAVCTDISSSSATEDHCSCQESLKNRGKYHVIVYIVCNHACIYMYILYLVASTCEVCSILCHNDSSSVGEYTGDGGTYCASKLTIL